MKRNIIMDMGTTNTRLYLINGSELIDKEHLDLGGRDSIQNGRDFLFKNLRSALGFLLNRNGLKESDIESVVAYGVAGSEYGVAEVLHISLPVSAKTLAENMKEFNIPEFCSLPVFVIPGVMVVGEDGSPMEIMRGEETEIMGLDSTIFEDERSVVLMPGTHCKSVTVDKNHNIFKFISGMTGEMMQVLSTGTILSQKCRIDAGNLPQWQIKGALWCKENGINSALLAVRTLQSRTKSSLEEISSFFVGAVLYPEIENILKKNPDATFYVGGKKVLRELYARMLRHFGAERVRELDNAENLGLKGAIRISSLRK